MMRDWLLSVGLFVIALSLNLGAVEQSPFHPDETRWLHRAHYLRDLSDPFGPTWRDWYLTRGQPPLGSYLMGLGLLAQGRDLETNGLWSFRHDAAWNRVRGNMASSADLEAGRRTNAVVGALAVVAVYLAGRSLTNRAGGVAGALLLAVHPLMTTLSSQALSDALLVLLVAAAVVAGVRLTARPGWPWALALGAALGLGAATKLSPLLVTAPLALLGVLLVLGARWSKLGRSSRDARLGRHLLAQPVIAGGVFVAVYPYLWPHPIGRTVGLFRFRVEEMARQGENWTRVAVESRAEALARIGERLGREYSASGQVADWLRGADMAVGLSGLVILIGLVMTLRSDRRFLVASTILGSQASLIVLGLRSDYARYTLPIVLVLALGGSISVGAGWAALVGLARAQWHRVEWWWLALRLAARRLVTDPLPSPATWALVAAGCVIALVGAGTVLGDDLPEIVALPATPRATPLGNGTPLAATLGATPLIGPLGTPVAGTPVATPFALTAAIPEG